MHGKPTLTASHPRRLRSGPEEASTNFRVVNSSPCVDPMSALPLVLPSGRGWELGWLWHLPYHVVSVFSPTSSIRLDAVAFTRPHANTPGSRQSLQAPSSSNSDLFAWARALKRASTNCMRRLCYDGGTLRPTIMPVAGMVPARGRSFTHPFVSMRGGSFGTGGSRAEAQKHDLVGKV